jgi:hypothetical protein
MSYTQEDFEKPAETEKEIWAECAARLKIATDAESENRIKGIDALKFRWGDQWDADIRNSRKISGRPALTINHTNVFCSRLENTLRQQRPRIKCHPVGSGANVDTAATVNGLIRHIEDASKASVAYDTGVTSALNIGWGYWRIISRYLDPLSFDQELVILPIRNTFTVYMDPGAVMPDGRDAKWCIISEKMKRAEYRRTYKNAKNADYRYAEAPGDMVTDWDSKEEIRLAEYYRIHEIADTLCGYSDGSTKLKSQITDATEQAYAAINVSKVSERPTTRYEVQWFRLNGTEVIDKRVDPGEHIPVVRCEGNVQDINGRVIRKGAVEDLKDPAQMFNYWRTAQTESLALQPKAPWVVAEGQTEGRPEWDDANQKPYSKLVYKPVAGPDGLTMLPPPQRSDPPQVPAGFIEAAAGAEHDLMAVAGMPQENPEIASRVVGGNKYLQRRQGMQDLTHYQYYDNQTLAIAWTGVLLLERIPHYYDTERTQRILGEDGVPQVVRLNENSPEGQKNNVKVGRYAVVMDTGPGYATKREEAAENMVNLLGTPLGEVIVKTGPDIILRNMDFHGADELADRAAVETPGGMEKLLEGLPKQAQNIVGALQAQLQQKDQLIQQQALELKYKGSIEAAKIEAGQQKVEKDNRTKADLAQLDSATQLEIQERKDATARDVAEIHAGAQLLNTHLESREEEKAADRLIKSSTEDRR